MGFVHFWAVREPPLHALLFIHARLQRVAIKLYEVSRLTYVMVYVCNECFVVERELTRIYTRTGDDGTTSLVGGGRSSKDSPVIETGGDIDELSALIGVARSLPLPDGVDAILQTIQERLLVIGIAVATPEGVNARVPEIREEDTLKLENEIDALQIQLPPLDRFIFPGGSPAGAQLHLARAVARRVERRCVALGRVWAVAPELISWINRLSDMLFVLARFVNTRHYAPEKSPDVITSFREA